MYTRPCLQLVRLQRANNLLSSQHPCIHYNVKKFSYNEHPFARCKWNPLYRTIITARKQSYRKAMFSQESVCSRGGDPNVTITHGALDLAGIYPPGKIRWGIPFLLPVTSGVDHWKSVQTCSFGTRHSDIWWSTLKRTVSKWASATGMLSFFYRLPTKLGEANVFTGVCPSFCPQLGGRGCLWYQVPSVGGYVWEPRQWDTIDKRAVRILLEFFLVAWNNHPLPLT